jgi:hypothetical protein
MSRLHKCLLTCAWSVLLTIPAVEALALVESGVSAHVIYVAKGAPASVHSAAQDLKHYLLRVAGADVAVVHEPAQHMIALGDTSVARQAGIRAEALPWEAYRIVTRGSQLFIVGRDTGKDERTPGGGVSNGTRNGVATFVEQFLGVRWLMPGKHGDYVPKSPTVTLPDIDMSDAPFFRNRRLPYTQERRREVKRWWARQKLGVELALSHGHNWKRIPTSAFDEHPDWFAEKGGRRVPPRGEYKLCMTNEGMIAAFAEAAVRHFDAHPVSSTFSLSPSDGGGWCDCGPCRNMYEDDPHGKLSVTPAVIHFYNEVARRVAPQHPDRMLAGYVYATYVYPPRNPIKLHPNVFLVWAPSFDYGFTLFRPALQKQWDELAPQWTKVTENIAYYDLPNCVSNSAGAPNPPALKILKFLYPRLKKHGMKGVYIYGNAAWGHSAPMNYIMAKLAWDPEADVDALFEEFFDKAYGLGAGEMKRFYHLLDAETERHFIEFERETYTLSNDRLKGVYAANFPELERLYRLADSKISDPDAKARLAMLGMNLTSLHWNLRQFNYLESPEASSFYMEDGAFMAYAQEHSGSLALASTRRRHKAALPDGELVLGSPGSVPNGEESRPFLLRGKQMLVVRPTAGQTAVLRFRTRRSYGSLLWYHVYGPDGKELSRGTLNSRKPAPIPAGDAPYVFVEIRAGSAFYEVEVTGAAWSADARVTDKGLHLIQQVTPLYFDVPADVPSFRLWLAAGAPGETAAATLFSPKGRAAAEFDCTQMEVDQQRISVSPGEAGIWKLVPREAATGVLDDVWVKPGKELSGFLSFSPEQVLTVRPAEK